MHHEERNSNSIKSKTTWILLQLLLLLRIRNQRQYYMLENEQISSTSLLWFPLVIQSRKLTARHSPGSPDFKASLICFLIFIASSAVKSPFFSVTTCGCSSSLSLPFSESLSASGSCSLCRERKQKGLRSAGAAAGQHSQASVLQQWQCKSAQLAAPGSLICFE